MHGHYEDHLVCLRDVRLNQLLRAYIDGVPLDLASALLPRRTRLNFGLLTHIHIHAGAQKRYAGAEVKSRGGSMSRQAMTGLIESLESTIQKLDWTPRGTEWGNYYDITNYSDAAFEHKKQLVGEWSAHLKPALTCTCVRCKCRLPVRLATARSVSAQRESLMLE